MARNNGKPSRKEKKKARKELAALLKRLRKGCDVINQVSDWRDMAADVEAVVHDNYRAIPAGHRQRLLAALELPEATLGAMNSACRVLQAEVGKTAAAVGGASILSGAVVTAVLFTAAVVLGAAVLFNQTAVDLHVINQGCGPLEDTDAFFANSSLLSLVGLDLLPEAVASGGDAVIPVSPVQFETDYDQNARVLTVYGPGQIQVASIPVGGVGDIRFNGQSLLVTGPNSRRAIDFSRADEHRLEIDCGG